MTVSQIAEIHGVSEGLEYKIHKAAQSSPGIEELISSIKSKRITQSKITRILMCCLLNITRQIVSETNNCEGLYARVLGFRKSAEIAFSYLSQKSRIPVITRGTQLPVNQFSKTDITAGDVYALFCANSKAGLDYSSELIIV